MWGSTFNRGRDDAPLAYCRVFTPDTAVLWLPAAMLPREIQVVNLEGQSGVAYTVCTALSK